MTRKAVEKKDKPDPGNDVKESASPVCYQNDAEIQPDYRLSATKPSKSAENKST